MSDETDKLEPSALKMYHAAGDSLDDRVREAISEAGHNGALEVCADGPREFHGGIVENLERHGYDVRAEGDRLCISWRDQSKMRAAHTRLKHEAKRDRDLEAFQKIKGVSESLAMRRALDPAAIAEAALSIMRDRSVPAADRLEAIRFLRDTAYKGSIAFEAVAFESMDSAQLSACTAILNDAQAKLSALKK